MRTLETLHAMGISYGVLNTENVIIDSLSPLRFILANLSYACKHTNNFDIHHETDVRMAVQTVLESSPKTFPQDPVARSIFEDLQSKMRKRLVLAKEFQHAFDPITVRGGPDYPFSQTSFNRTYPLNHMRGRCYRRSDISAIARAHLSEDIYRAWKIHQKISQIDAVRHLPKSFGDYIDWKAVQSIMDEVGCCELDFSPPRFSSEIDVPINITRHKALDLWNISQLLAARHPMDPVDIQPRRAVRILGEQVVTGLYVDSQTFSDTCNRIVGLKILEPALSQARLTSEVIVNRGTCEEMAKETLQDVAKRSLIRDTRPKSFHLDRTGSRLGPPRNHQPVFAPAEIPTSPSLALVPSTLLQLSTGYHQSPGFEEDFFLADRGLFLGLAAFDPISQTLEYASTTYSETTMLQLCEKLHLPALKIGIKQSRDQDLDAILRGAYDVDCYSSEHDSYSVSHSSSRRFGNLTQRAFLDKLGTNPKERSSSQGVNKLFRLEAKGLGEHDSGSKLEKIRWTKSWVEEQHRRKRRRNDIRPTRWTGKGRNETSSIPKTDRIDPIEESLIIPSSSRASTIQGKPSHYLSNCSSSSQVSTVQGHVESRPPLETSLVSWSSTEENSHDYYRDYMTGLGDGKAEADDIDGFQSSEDRNGDESSEVSEEG